MKISERLVLIGFKSVWGIARVLPQAIMVTVFVTVGKLLFKRESRGRKILQFNLSRVLNLDFADPEVIKVTRQSFLNYLRYFAEMFSMIRIENSDLESKVEISGLEILHAAMALNRGVIVVAPHAGNWDLAGAVAAQRFGRLTTVAEVLKPQELFELFVASRTSRGIEILPHRGGAIPAFEILKTRLRDGGLTAMATDRDLSRSGVEVEFFGHMAKMPSGPARLFQETGCVVLAVKVFFSGQKTKIEFLPPFNFIGDVQRDTQLMADNFAEIIKANPENWFMMQQIWLNHPREFGGR